MLDIDKWPDEVFVAIAGGDEDSETMTVRKIAKLLTKARRKNYMEGSAYHGWKFGLPDKFWPVTLDNFFDNPDEIRELGLRMVKGDESELSSLDKGRWPGIRSETLWKVDKELAHKITERVLSCYFNFNYEQIT